MYLPPIKWHSLYLILGVMFAPSTYAQSYFEQLAARSDVVVAIAFRSHADIEANWAPNNHDDMAYDPVQDALMSSWPHEGNAAGNIDNIQIDIDPDISSGNVFVTWEERWGPNWAASGDGGSINGISTFKNNHYSDADPYDSGGTQLEIRKLMKKSALAGTLVPAGKAGFIDIRTYFGAKGDAADRFIGLRNDYLLDIEVWARYFLFIEYGGNGKVSLWVTQPAEVPTAIYSQAPGDSSGDPGPFKSFWFQHNSSKTYTGGTSHVWNRNFVVLDGVADIAEAQALVDQGAEDLGTVVVRPKSLVLEP